MLHIITNNQTSSFNYCQQSLAAGDSLIFIDDGIYLLIRNNIINVEITKTVDVYALNDDVNARGLSSKLPKYIQKIDYDSFVALTEKYQTNQTW